MLFRVMIGAGYNNRSKLSRIVWVGCKLFKCFSRCYVTVTDRHETVKLLHTFTG